MKAYVSKLLDVEQFITLEEAMNIELIPEDYHEFFERSKMCNCGSPLVTNLNLTVLKCSNPNCIYKLSSRLANSYQMFFKGIGIEGCRSMVSAYGLKNMIDAYEKCDYAYREAVSDWLMLPHYIGDIITFLSIPYIGNSAKDIFPDMKTFNYVRDYLLFYGWTELYSLHGKKMDDEKAIRSLNDIIVKYPNLYPQFKAKLEEQDLKIEPNNMEDFANMLRTLGMSRYVRTRINGIKNSIKIAISLVDHFDELCYFVDKASIRSTVAEVHSIVITGDILMATYPDGTPFTSKQEYVDFINNIIADCGICYKLSTALVNTQYIIADTDAPTRKYMAGKQMNKLITSDAFLKNIINARTKFMELAEEEKRKKGTISG